MRLGSEGKAGVPAMKMEIDRSKKPVNVDVQMYSAGEETFFDTY